MGLLNRLFGGKKRLAKEIEKDEEKIIKTWRLHLNSYSLRDDLSRFFKINRVDEALKKPDELVETLNRIKATLSEELIETEDEERLEDDIIKYLEKLASKESKDHSYELAGKIKAGKIEEETVRRIFMKIYEVLSTELHAIRLIKEKIRSMKRIRFENEEKQKLMAETKKMLQNLFYAICIQEAYLYAPLNPGGKVSEHFEKVNDAVRAVLLEEKFEEAIQTAEDRMVDVIVQIIAKETHNREKSMTHAYWRLVTEIFDDLIEMAGVPSSYEEIDLWEKRLRKIIGDDIVMERTIRKNSPNSSDEETKVMIRAFRKSYSYGYFSELIAGIVTEALKRGLD